MAKDPAFLFYSDNFQSGTQFFTDEQTGKYIRLLCAQHLHGHLEEKHMLFICGSYDVDIWRKFAKDQDGKYYNERMEFEVSKRKRYSESRSSNRKSTTNDKKQPKNISSTYDNHMGNENGIGNGDENINGKRYSRGEILDLPKTKLGAAKQLLKIAKGIESTDEQITGLWEIFKEQNISGEKWYKSKNDVYSHFINWIKNQKINGPQTITHSVKTAGGYELLEKLRVVAGGK